MLTCFSGVKARQLDILRPVTEATGSAVGTVESTVGGTFTGSLQINCMLTYFSALKSRQDDIPIADVLHERQLGNLPASLDQTIQFALVGLSGNPTGLYGALNNLRTIVNAGDISHENLTNMPQAIQDVIAHLSTA